MTIFAPFFALHRWDKGKKKEGGNASPTRQFLFISYHVCLGEDAMIASMRSVIVSRFTCFNFIILATLQ